MVKHNNVLPNQRHFRKEWQSMVKTWLDQPMRKRRRRLARKARAAAVAPRPASGALRPVVRCQTQRYNIRVRAGRGFTLEELKTAGVNPLVAPTIGIAVDHRRRNKSTQSLEENVARLKAYMAKLVVFPRKSGTKAAAKAGVDRKTLAALTQVTGDFAPIVSDTGKNTAVELTAELKAKLAYRTLRQERTNARLVGRRAKKAAEAAAKGETGVAAAE